jgi:hypothetical protein
VAGRENTAMEGDGCLEVLSPQERRIVRRIIERALTHGRPHPKARSSALADATRARLEQRQAKSMAAQTCPHSAHASRPRMAKGFAA